MNIQKRFWSKVSRTDGPYSCWKWTAGVNAKGYGQFNTGRSMSGTLAHRVAWELVNGPIPKGLFVCHHCDNPSCCNPTHLFLGTPKDNTQDGVYKGHWHQAGENNNQSKLTLSQVNTIRRLYGCEGNTATTLSQQFGVTTTCIRQIITKKHWR